MSENAMMLAPVQTVSLEREAAGYQALLGVIMQAGEFGKGLLKNIATPLDALALADAGAAFGMTPLTALRSFHMVEGKPVLAADRMVALCLAHPACMAFGVEVSTADRCVYVGRRRQRDGSITEQRVEWTMKRAQAAGVAGKPVWKQYPDQMLRARAGSELARMLFPDAMAGIYTAEELGDVPPVFEPARPAPAGHRMQHPREQPALARVEDAEVEEPRYTARPVRVPGEPWMDVELVEEPANADNRPMPNDVAPFAVWWAYDTAQGKDPEGLKTLVPKHARNRAEKLNRFLGFMRNGQGKSIGRPGILNLAERTAEEVPTATIETMLGRLEVAQWSELGGDHLAGFVAALLREREAVVAAAKKG